jgi:hypothetical protein
MIDNAAKIGSNLDLVAIPLDLPRLRRDRRRFSADGADVINPIGQFFFLLSRASVPSMLHLMKINRQPHIETLRLLLTSFFLFPFSARFLETSISHSIPANTESAQST